MEQLVKSTGCGPQREKISPVEFAQNEDLYFVWEGKEEVANGTPVRMISPKCPQRCLRFSRLGVPNLLNISNGSRPCLGEQLREGRSPLIRRAGATGDRKSVV